MIIEEKNFERIYNTHFETLCRFLNYYTQESNVIEDVVQEAFVNLWVNNYGKDIQYIKTYLYNSVRNLMLNHLRDQANHAVILTRWAKIELEKDNAEDCVDREIFYHLLQVAVETLPQKCKEIYMMSREGNLSYKEIAALKNISVKTVENQMGIALKKIREYLLYHSQETALIFILIEMSK